jgi:hypothetical protein
MVRMILRVDPPVATSQLFFPNFRCVLKVVHHWLTPYYVHLVGFSLIYLWLAGVTFTVTTSSTP